MSTLRALQATRSSAGISEEDARDIYERMGFPRSTRDMSDQQRKAARAEIERLYPDAKYRSSKTGRKPLEGPYAKKLQALWISAWNLGLVANRDDAALVAFVKRQTGIEQTRWLRDPKDAEKAVEALKSWIKREAGVRWEDGKYDAVWMSRFGFKIAKAQFRILHPALAHTTAMMPAFWVVVAALTKRIGQDDITDADWIVVMNELGRRIREMKAAKAKVA
ncbi:MAG: regulatory protein GemA [Pseudomonadota bacterium]